MPLGARIVFLAHVHVAQRSELDHPHFVELDVRGLEHGLRVDVTLHALPEPGDPFGVAVGDVALLEGIRAQEAAEAEVMEQIRAGRYDGRYARPAPPPP